MTPNLTHYLNKTILVSIPALFEDGICRPCKLISAEINGLWLQSEELSERLLPHAKRENRHLAAMAPVVFVPFAQIAGVLVTTAPPAEGSYRAAQKTQEATKTRTKGAQHSLESHARDRNRK